MLDSGRWRRSSQKVTWREGVWNYREHGVLGTMAVSWDREESVDGLGKGRKSREFCSAALLAQAGCELQGAQANKLDPSSLVQIQVSSA